MASELRVNTLKDASGNNSVGMSYVAEGSGKEWHYFDGNTSNTIRDSFNLSSATDQGTGDYLFFYTNNMNSAFYCQTNFSQWTDPASGNAYSVDGAGNVETTRCRHLHYENGSLADPQQRFINIQGDLA